MWHHYLQEKDRSAGTVIKYIQAVTHFLAWYEQKDHAPLTLEALTSIALIGYGNEQHQGVTVHKTSALEWQHGHMVQASGERAYHSLLTFPIARPRE